MRGIILSERQKAEQSYQRLFPILFPRLVILFPTLVILFPRHGNKNTKAWYFMFSAFIIFSWYVDRESLYLSGTTNEHKCALTEGRANLYPSGLKIPPYDIKTNEFSWTTKGHASNTYIAIF